MLSWLQRKSNKLNTPYLTDIIHKTTKPLCLQKLQITQNINKLMFQVIFIFFDLILIKQIIVCSTPFTFGEIAFKKIMSRVLSAELGHE